MLNVEQPVTIYLDKRKALSQVRLQFLCPALPLMLSIIVLQTLSPVPPHGFDRLRAWCLLATFPLLYFLEVRKITGHTNPIMALSSKGITVQPLYTHLGFLRWDEIKDIYAFRLVYSRHVGITLKDPKALYRRIGLKHGWMLQTSGFLAPLFRLFGIRVATINIPQEHLPMSADELVTQIQTYRANYS